VFFVLAGAVLVGVAACDPVKTDTPPAEDTSDSGDVG